MTRRLHRLTRGALLASTLLALGQPARAIETPGAEQVPPGEAEAIGTIVSMIEAGVNAAARAGQRPVLRDAHAKGHGCVAATVTVDADLPPDLKRGVFAEGRSYPAWIRFSNGRGSPQSDRAGDVRGMAIKLVGVPGPKILPDEADAVTQDFVLIDFPRFFLRDAAEYVPFLQAAFGGRETLGAHFAANPAQGQLFSAMESRTPDHLFTQRFFSMTPSLLGERPVKHGARPIACEGGGAPVATAPPSGDPDHLRAGMASWLDGRDACFRFTVQRQADATMPVEDPTVLWDEARSVPVEVATIRIPRQRFDGADRQAFCENLSFTPWHSLAEHRPLGGTNRVRKAVYLAISKLRHDLNRAPRAEPAAVELPSAETAP